MTPLHKAVEIVLEGFTLPDDARKILEAAYYAAPQQPEPLTDEQMWEIWNAQGTDEMNQVEAIAFARLIEAAHGIGGGEK